MTKYSVLLLPFIALAIMIFLAMFYRDRNISKKFRSRNRRRMWVGRLTVFMLLLSTVVTLIWPVYGMSGVLQGLLITSLGMLPAMVIHVMASVHYGSPSIVLSLWSGLKRQISRSSMYVRSLHSGGQRAIDGYSTEPMNGQPIFDLPHSVINQSSDTADSNNLTCMDTHHAPSLVTSLTEEREKLQRLINAQQAAIESGREANIRNREVARNAVRLMNCARDNQKRAENMAQRELAERQRLELEYRKVCNDLEKMQSIITSGQGSSNPVEGR